MKLRDLMETGAKISLSVSLDDLRELFKEVSMTVLPKQIDKPAPDF